MERLSNFQKRIKQLNVPYAKTQAHILFGRKKYRDLNSVSTFWHTTDFFPPQKYKHVTKKGVKE